MRSEVCGYVLRPARPDDREYILNGVKAGILSSVHPAEAAASELWVHDILEITSANLDGRGMVNEAFILQDGDETCGMLWMGVSRDEYTCDLTGYILGIFVNEDLRGKGIGKELLNVAEEWCRDNGLLSITLNVGAWNKARDLYGSASFYERSRVMRKDLM